MKPVEQTLSNGFQVGVKEDFTPNVNPFIQDAFHMGTALDKDTMLMYASHEHNKYFIVVHIPTGKRMIVYLPE